MKTLREKYNALESKVSKAFSELLKEKTEYELLDSESVENGEFDDYFEYRNEITGNVIDIAIIKVTQDGIYAVEREDNTKFHTITLSDLASTLDKINLCELMNAKLKF